MEKLTTEVLRHVGLEINQRKVEIDAYYAELKMKLPLYIRTLTIGELRQAGAIVGSDIYFSNEINKRLVTTAETAKKRLDLIKRIEEIREQYRNQIIAHYGSLKKRHTKELLKKKMGQLSIEDCSSLGIQSRK